jgi:hypothetical protein
MTKRRDAPRADDDKPPWLAHNERQRKWMKDWSNAKLDEVLDSFDKKNAALARLLTEIDPKALRDLAQKPFARLRTKEFAIEQAARGNIEPLKKLHPEYAPFFAPPKRKRGGKRLKKTTSLFMAQSRLEEAVAEKKRLHAIWMKNYGKKNRPKGQLTAEEIVAERWGLDEEEVCKQRLSHKRLSRLAGET